MSNVGRINGFDALRTVAMWLGVLLHSVIIYKTVKEPNWPHDPQPGSHIFEWLYHYIHSFRMPLFFMVAGFFARMVLLRSGADYFISQRFKRIVIPFILATLILVPLTLLPFHFYNYHHLMQVETLAALKKSMMQMIRWNGMAHLWFLYYLIIFYIFSLVSLRAADKFKIAVFERLQPVIAHLSLLKLIVPLAVLMLILVAYGVDAPPVYTGIKPNLLYILYYGFFYLCGWIMQVNMKSISSLKNNAWVLSVLGTVLSVIQFFHPGLYIGVPVAAALQTTCLVFGITGLFIKYFHAESPLWRYCSDAAYWVYLVHMCIVATVQVLLINSPVPGALRFPLVLFLALGISTLTYHLFVRYTIIGVYLHGARKRPHEA